MLILLRSVDHQLSEHHQDQDIPHHIKPDLDDIDIDFQELLEHIFHELYIHYTMIRDVRQSEHKVVNVDNHDQQNISACKITFW